MGNNKNQKDKIRSVLFAIQAANVPLKMRHLRIGYNLEQAIRNSGVVIKAGNGVIWNKGKFITESLVDQIFEDSYNLGVQYREQAKKKEEQQFKFFVESSNKPVGTITDVKEDSKGIQIEFEQSSKQSKRIEIASLLRQIADILEK
jgi:hypothetical protein